MKAGVPVSLPPQAESRLPRPPLLPGVPDGGTPPLSGASGDAAALSGEADAAAAPPEPPGAAFSDGAEGPWVDATVDSSLNSIVLQPYLNSQAGCRPASPNCARRRCVRWPTRTASRSSRK